LEISVFITSAVVAALVSGLLTLHSAERKIQIENITQERAKWREKIRTQSLLVHKAACLRKESELKELYLTFSHLLNPFDSEDTEILNVILSLGKTENPELRLPEFTKRIAYLLKHDWERAKHETKPWFFKFKLPAITKFP
jgi:hypothetical protein